MTCQLKVLTKVHTTKPTSSTQLLRTVNSKAVLTEQASGFRLRKNFKSKAHKKKRYRRVEGRHQEACSIQPGRWISSALSLCYLETSEDRDFLDLKESVVWWWLLWFLFCFVFWYVLNAVTLRAPLAVSALCLCPSAWQVKSILCAFKGRSVPAGHGAASSCLRWITSLPAWMPIFDEGLIERLVLFHRAVSPSLFHYSL